MGYESGIGRDQLVRVGVLARRARLSLGMTQVDLARRCGVSERAVRTLETGHMPSRSRTVDLVLTALRSGGADVAELARAAEGLSAELTGRSTPVPAQLPADIGSFTGRATDLARMDGMLDRSGHAQMVCVISGPGGIGKTALATHWAHRVADAFPDGSLYVNLDGYAERPPMDPADALGGFLRAFGIAGPDIPERPADRTAQLRTLLARRRVLLLLDNARSAEQVRPLLPGATGCTVVVTSRDRLDGLASVNDAQLIGLATLDFDEGRRLLARMVGDALVRAEEEAAAELVDRCGRLPLALRVVATNINATGATLAAVARELRTDPLPALEVPGDPGSAVRRTFELSYAALDQHHQRLFRRTALIPGPDFTSSVLAVLAQVTATEAHAGLRTLVAVTLVDRHPTPTGTNRYRSHDLLRAFAQSKLISEEPEGDRTEAAGRLAEWYLAAATTAAQWAVDDVPIPPGDAVTRRSAAAVPLPFTDASQALEWLHLEFPAIMALARGDALGSTPALAWRLANAIRAYVSHTRTTAEHKDLAVAAEIAAKASAQPAAWWVAHHMAAVGSLRAADYPSAIDHASAAADLAKRLDWSRARSTSLNLLARAHSNEGDYVPAEQAYRQAMVAGVRAGGPRSTAQTQNNLGTMLLEAGRLDDAEQTFRAVLADHSAAATIDTITAAHPLTNLSEVLWLRGRLAESATVARQALRISRRTRYQTVELLSVLMLGRTLATSGLVTQARHCLAEADQLRDRGVYTDDIHGAAVMSAGALAAIGDHATASSVYHQVIEFGDGQINVNHLARAQVGMGRIHLAAGELGRAHDHASVALGMARTSRLRVPVGQALNLLAAVQLRRGILGEAINLATAALTAHQQTGHRPGEARSHQLLSVVHTRLGDHAVARHHRQYAQECYRSIGGQVVKNTLIAVEGGSLDRPAATGNNRHLPC